MAFNLTFKSLAKHLLGKEMFEMAELLAPPDERYVGNSIYWQWEYSKAVSIQPNCNGLMRSLVGCVMLCNIGS